MSKVVANGVTIDVSSLSDAQIKTALESALDADNHAAQNVTATTSDREWFAQYCDLHVRIFGQLVAL